MPISGRCLALLSHQDGRIVTVSSPTRAGLASPELFRANFCLVQEALQPKTFLIAIKKITDHFYIHFMWFDDGGFQGSV